MPKGIAEGNYSRVIVVEPTFGLRLGFGYADLGKAFRISTAVQRGGKASSMCDGH